MAGHDLAADNNNSNSTLEHIINYCFSFSKTKLVRARKVAGSRRPLSKTAEEPLIPIMFVTIKLGSKTIILKALLDSGAGASLIAEKHCTTHKIIAKKASFKTVAGNFHTAGVIKTAFRLAELNPTAKVDYNLHVVNTLGVYDMILGRDILKSLGIVLNHTTETISWDDATIPMKTASARPIKSFHIKDPEGVDDMVGHIAGDRYKTILEAKYEKADLKKEVEDNCLHLKSSQRKQLIKLLTKFEKLFDGTLGTWKNTKYNIELKPGATPYHGRPYSIP